METTRHRKAASKLGHKQSIREANRYAAGIRKYDDKFHLGETKTRCIENGANA